MEEYIFLEENICKSISGNEDENGNYIFEVEASNENLDLQNQITLQSALLKSKEYFLSNGVVSDDHLHKTRNEDGSVETHKEKIIGEPISVRTDGKSTFVKGILYKGVEAAKPYIELLKNKSSRVKASIGGVMPKIVKNKDGSETITSFMWNDLALTVSPVNWTVGSACFAKSMGIIEFCKSLNAGCGTDVEKMEGGRVLQEEDLEEETQELLDIKEEGLKDKEKKTIKKCLEYFCKEIITDKNMAKDFLVRKGFDEERAELTAEEICIYGGKIMAKSNFKAELKSLLKSFKDDEEDKKEDLLFEEEDEEIEKSEDEEFDFEEEDEEIEKSEDEDFDDDIEEDEDEEMKKSFIDGTGVIEDLIKSVKLLKKENSELKKSIIDVTKSFSEVLKTPTENRKSIVSKSISHTSDNVKKGIPTSEDFDILKSALVKASKNKKISLEEVQFYSSEFQKSMSGMKINPSVWNKICSIVRENR